ncbi:MAG: protein translocase subunit SecD [Actinomycetota bacterium]
MKRRTRGWWFSIFFVLVLVIASVVGWVAGITPVLGLDLEGGVSVTLSAPQSTSEGVMNRALESIRRRVDAFGVAEPDIFVTGNNIEVQIPGLAEGTIQERQGARTCLVGEDDRNFGCFETGAEAQEALDGYRLKDLPEQFCITGSDGQFGCFESEKSAQTALDGITVAEQGEQFCALDANGGNLRCFDTKQEGDAFVDQLRIQPRTSTCVRDDQGDDVQCFPSEEQADALLAAIRPKEINRQFCVVSSTGEGLGCFLTQEKAQARLQETGQERLIQLIGTTARLEEREVLETLEPGLPGYEQAQVTCATLAQRETPSCSFEGLADREVVFQGEGDPATATKYRLGPVRITGEAIRKATAIFIPPGAQSGGTPGWQVEFQLTSEGKGQFGDVTTELVGRQLAIILDQEVISAPSINEPITGGSGVITGDFTEQEARDLSTTLNSGSLPVQLTQQQLVTVSPTLGSESLRQGLVAGIAGLLALALYLFFYYRILGVVAWFGMAIWAVLVLGLVSLGGEAFGYSLTLAGIAGLVISLGVTADSYIVFFERFKDEVRKGKTPRSAVGPAFEKSWRTIIAADVVTGIAAFGLYITAVSSVRGFALTLGVSVMLDLFVVYFFKRPTVFLLARNSTLVDMRGVGVRAGLGIQEEPPEPEPVPVAGGSR